MAHLEELEAWHIHSLYKNLRRERPKSYVQFRDIILAYHRWGHIWVGVHDGECIGMAGVASVMPNVGHAWFYLSRKIVRHRMWFHRTVVREFKALKATKEFHRIQADVNTNFDTGLEWIKRLGLECEGKSRKYYENGDDAFRYAWIDENG